MIRAMSPLDARSIGFEAFGVRVAVAAGADAADRLGAALPPARRECDPATAQVAFELVAVPDGTAVIRDGEPFTDGVPLDTALEVLEREVRTEIALHAPDRIFVHAGVVAHQGRGLVLPGASFTGKSTLVAALVRAGATYYSDEYAVLDQEGRVHPYARRLALRGENGVARLHDASDLGGAVGELPVPVAAIAVTTYLEGSEWDAASMSHGEAVLALLENTVPARTRPQESLRAATRAVDGATLQRGERGDANRTAALLLDDLRRY
jgi:hypothetical protein